MINLVGILYERGRRTFKAIHTDAAAAIARAAREAGASQFIQMSALGAAKDKPDSKRASVDCFMGVSSSLFFERHDPITKPDFPQAILSTPA